MVCKAFESHDEEVEDVKGKEKAARESSAEFKLSAFKASKALKIGVKRNDERDMITGCREVYSEGAWAGRMPK